MLSEGCRPLKPVHELDALATKKKQQEISSESVTDAVFGWRGIES
jgi:hypothetical protein